MKENTQELKEKELKKAKKKAKKKKKKEKGKRGKDLGNEGNYGDRERGNEGEKLGNEGDGVEALEPSTTDEPLITGQKSLGHQPSSTDHCPSSTSHPTTSDQPSAFSPLQDAFINAWQEAGQTWGLPPAMGAVHAVLLSRDRAWSTDEVMEALEISRGNAHMQLKALVEWGVVHAVRQLGSRRIGYVAERDVWRIATAVAKQRRKRELQPILEMGKLLRAHGAASRSMDDRALKGTMREIVAFGKLMDKLLMETLKRDERWWERLVRRWINRS